VEARTAAIEICGSGQVQVIFIIATEKNSGILLSGYLGTKRHQPAGRVRMAKIVESYDHSCHSGHWVRNAGPLGAAYAQGSIELTTMCARAIAAQGARRRMLMVFASPIHLSTPSGLHKKNLEAKFAIPRPINAPETSGCFFLG
jgi:hypothetical protein